MKGWFFSIEILFFFRFRYFTCCNFHIKDIEKHQSWLVFICTQLPYSEIYRSWALVTQASSFVVNWVLFILMYLTTQQFWFKVVYYNRRIYRFRWQIICLGNDKSEWVMESMSRRGGPVENKICFLESNFGFARKITD